MDMLNVIDVLAISRVFWAVYSQMSLEKFSYDWYYIHYDRIWLMIMTLRIYDLQIMSEGHIILLT